MWCVNIHHEGGIYRGEWDIIDLDRLVWHQVVVCQPSHVAGWPCGAASTDFSTDSGFSSSCRRMATKARDEPPQTLGQVGLASGALGPRVKYTHMVMMILTFDQLHFVIP
jgi:hypothetical protein